MLGSLTGVTGHVNIRRSRVAVSLIVLNFLIYWNVLIIPAANDASLPVNQGCYALA